jgi:cytochrome c
MQAANIVWNEENLAKYIADPKGFVAGNKMAFAGIKKEEDLKNLLAYLAEAAK